MRFARYTLSAGAAAGASLMAMPAMAHHPLAGEAMTTFGDGLLSGIGHPIIGFDHLFFIAAMGVAAAFTAQRYLAPLAFIVAMALGIALVVSGITLPLVEPVIALSLLVVGVLIMRGRALAMTVALGLFAVVGLFHGWAFGEALAGQEGGAPLPVAAGYLIGLAATQWAIAVGAGLLVTNALKATQAAAMPARLAGAAVAGMGLFLTLEVAEAAVFSALGIG